MVCAVYHAPTGPIALAEEDGALVRVYLPGSDLSALPLGDTPLLCRAVGQLEEYFSGRRREFDLPLRPRGTAFQEEVWRALAAVPYGATTTYAALAAAVGRPKAARAVGLAMHDNPLAIFLPCHRVVGASGSLTGYAGGLDMKRALLALEQGAGRG